MLASVGTLQDEIQQRQPFRTLGHEAVIGILYTADLVRRVVADLVTRRGLTHQQYNVLRILRGAGADGLPTLEIARRMIDRTPGITRLLDRLESEGRVRRERCPADRRQVLCWITAKGNELLAELEPAIRAIEDRPRRQLNDAQLDSLIHLLDAIRSDFRTLCSDTPTSRKGERE